MERILTAADALLRMIAMFEGQKTTRRSQGNLRDVDRRIDVRHLPAEDHDHFDYGIARLRFR